MKRVAFWNIKSPIGNAKRQYEEGIGAYKLATIARQQGWDPIVLQDHNYGASPAAIAARTDELDPDIVCYSLMSYGIPLLEEIRETDKKRPIIIGGPAATIDPIAVAGLYRSHPMPVAVVQGDGEVLFRELLAGHASRWHQRAAYVMDSGQLHHGVLQLCSLDDSPFSDLSSSDQRHIAERAVANPTLPLEERIAWQRSLLTTQVESRKGCYYSCEFCSTSSMPDHRVRTASPKRLVAEMQHQAQQGIGFFALTDNIAFDYIEWWNEFAARVEASDIAPYIQFGGYGTPRMLDRPEWEPTIRRLYNVGLRSVILGVQAGSARILRDIIHRPADDPQRALALVDRYVPLGVNVKLDFIIGHPTETVEELQQTANWIDRLVAAGGEVFVRELNIVPHSGYERRLQQGDYTLPTRTTEHAALSNAILAKKRDDTAYMQRAFTNGIPNKYLIDRKRGIRYPAACFTHEELEQDRRKLERSAMPERLHERYAQLYDLVLLT